MGNLITVILRMLILKELCLRIDFRARKFMLLTGDVIILICFVLMPYNQNIYLLPLMNYNEQGCYKNWTCLKIWFCFKYP